MNTDRLLNIEEAAERLHVSKDWLYHHWKKLPFAVKIAKKILRFSAQGIDEFVKGPNNEGNKGN